ncbi:MAG TPA: 30S ribosomal protein S12 methylthiotransferase RimO [Candidatus Ruminococcus avistercoris]|nr:30S ribosomal protein S12 methylthiotransferase RimO [Candidatus Ruminococcus avistercoris]
MRILFISLGCDKNLVDSEEMLYLLREKGYEITDDEENADIIVVNTCCFIHDAKEESIDTILEMGKYRLSGKVKALIVTGCLAQRYREEILKEIPEVDAVLGTASYDDILEAVEKTLKGEKYLSFRPTDRLVDTGGGRIITTGGAYEYLRIAEGCAKHCTYCVIPKVRGGYRSIPMERLLDTARQMVGEGVKELIVIAQETTLYGTDLYGKKSLHILLEKLCRIEGLVWIRLLYCYPEEIYPELVDTIAREPKICHYLDLPIQHCSDSILKRMGRKTTKADLERIITEIRERIPDMVIRTTLITGFPGETKEDHEELMQFVADMAFDRLGVFTYSPEEDTPAAAMENQVPEEVKEQRKAELMELQQDISLELDQERIGEELLVFVEGKVADENAYVGRTYADAPGIDGYIFVNTGESLMTGDFVRVKVTGALEYDLIGEIADEYTE